MYMYTDLKSLIKKSNECKNSAEKSSTIKVGEHIPSVFSISDGMKIRVTYK